MSIGAPYCRSQSGEPPRLPGIFRTIIFSNCINFEPAPISSFFDRQIIAQALCEGIPVVTCDATFKRYEGLKVIW